MNCEVDQGCSANPDGLARQSLGSDARGADFQGIGPRQQIEDGVVAGRVGGRRTLLHTSLLRANQTTGGINMPGKFRCRIRNRNRD